MFSLKTSILKNQIYDAQRHRKGEKRFQKFPNSQARGQKTERRGRG